MEYKLELSRSDEIIFLLVRLLFLKKERQRKGVEPVSATVSELWIAITFHAQINRVNSIDNPFTHKWTLHFARVVSEAASNRVVIKFKYGRVKTVSMCRCENLVSPWGKREKMVTDGGGKSKTRRNHWQEMGKYDWGIIARKYSIKVSYLVLSRGNVDISLSVRLLLYL